MYQNEKYTGELSKYALVSVGCSFKYQTQASEKLMKHLLHLTVKESPKLISGFPWSFIIIGTEGPYTSASSNPTLS